MESLPPGIHLLGSVAGEPIDLQPRPLKEYVGSLALVFLALGCGAMALWLMLDGESQGAWALLALAVLFAAPAAFFLIRRLHSACTVQLYDGGFLWRRETQARALPFESVQSVSFTEEERLQDGILQGWSRRMVLQSEGPRQMLEHYQAFDQEDLMGPWMSQVLHRFSEELEKRFDQGQRIEGRGWRLDRRGLKSRRGLLEWDQITAADRLQGDVAIWRLAESMPTLRVPANSANALPLMLLIDRRVERPSAELGSELGRLRLDVRWPKIWAFLAGIPSVLLLSLAYFVFQEGSDLGTGFLFLIPGMMLLALALRHFFGRVRAFEHAMVRSSPFGERRLLFQDLKEMSYYDRALFHHGTYAGTSIQLTLVPQQGRPLKLTTLVRDATHDFVAYRDHVAAFLASRIRQRLHQGEEVRWTRKIWLTPDGLRFPHTRLWRQGQIEEVAYTDDLRVFLESDRLLLYLGEDHKPILKLPSRKPNFFPGLFVLIQKIDEAHDQDLQDLQAL